jgi:CobQ-like glutamine amidotransferase family enzyme
MKLKLVNVYPDLLGTYGDRGNVLILSAMLKLNGFPVEVVDLASNDRADLTGDFYFLGGGEDGPQALAASLLASNGLIDRAVANGKPVLAVCAGFQILGESFMAEGTRQRGLGILPVRTVTGNARSVGELVTAPVPIMSEIMLTGFENHSGVTEPLEPFMPLGKVLAGTGNGSGGVDGIVKGNVVGTYMHGPVLARNPQFAVWFASLAGLSIDTVTQTHLLLHSERLSAVQHRFKV